MATSNDRQYDQVETVRKWRISLPSVRLMNQHSEYNVIEGLAKNFPTFFVSMYPATGLCLPTETKYGTEEYDYITLNLKNCQ